MAEAGGIVTGSKGNYRLVRQLGSGGEGIVYITDKPDLVVKIYRKPEAQMERKLKSMLRHPLEPKADGVHLLIAWPQDVIYENGTFVGYAMPFVKDTYPIYVVCRNNEKHIKDCHEVFPSYDWRYSLMVAYHLAWTVSYIHDHGYIVGDMNSNNIVIHSDGTLTILDVDSFDVTDPETGERFPCGVGIGEFLAPELQGRNLRNARFTKHTDEFALAVHIFILLMNNTHPFTLRNLTPEEGSGNNVHTLCQEKRSIAQDRKFDNIVNGKCPFVREVPGYGIPWPSPRLEMLPKSIQHAFQQTFCYDAGNILARAEERTTANMWRVLLYDLYRRTTGPNPDLVRCSVNPEHFYLKSRGICEYCAAEKRYARFLGSQSAWSVQILTHNNAPEETAVSGTLSAGTPVYVHFRVTRGEQGKQEQLYFSWETSDGFSSGVTAFNHLYSKDETGWVRNQDPTACSHTVRIYDSKQNLLASDTFCTVPR